MISPAHTSSRLPRGAWPALIAALLGWAFDGVEMGLFPLIATPALDELLPSVADQRPWKAAVYALFLVGAALGGVLFGWLGDRFGRVRAMTWCVLVYALFAGACGFAHDLLQLALLRFISSLGMGGEWALGVALVMEVWPDRWRPLLAGLIGAAANVGMALVAWAGLYVQELGSGLGALGLGAESVSALTAHSGWRLLAVLGAAPALLTFFLRLFVAESPTWRTAAAAAPPARVREIFAPGMRRRTLLATALATVALLGTWGSVQWLPSVSDTLPGTVPGARSWTQILSAGGAALGALLAALGAQALNRRATYVAICALSLLACAGLFRTHQVWGPGFLAGSFLVGAVTASFYGWLPLYLPELFPTRLRAAAQGFAYNAGRVLTAAGVLAGNWMVGAVFAGDYAQMCALVSLVYAVGFVVIGFCPETKGRPLPE